MNILDLLDNIFTLPYEEQEKRCSHIGIWEFSDCDSELIGIDSYELATLVAKHNKRINLRKNKDKIINKHSTDSPIYNTQYGWQTIWNSKTQKWEKGFIGKKIKRIRKKID